MLFDKINALMANNIENDSSINTLAQIQICKSSSYCFEVELRSNLVYILSYEIEGFIF